jgi:hypothetical protein
MHKIGFFLFGLIGAVLLSQFPEFFQQYVQRLGGRLDEVTRQVAALDQRAEEAAKNTPDYIRGLLLHGDADVRREGLALQSLVQRSAALAEAFQALTGADGWWRAGSFVEHFDWDVASASFDDYRPAVPVTTEAAVYAGSGFGSGAILYLLTLGRLGRRRAPARRQRAAEREPVMREPTFRDTDLRDPHRRDPRSRDPRKR